MLKSSYVGVCAYRYQMKIFFAFPANQTYFQLFFSVKIRQKTVASKIESMQLTVFLNNIDPGMMKTTRISLYSIFDLDSKMEEFICF